MDLMAEVAARERGRGHENDRSHDPQHGSSSSRGHPCTASALALRTSGAASGTRMPSKLASHESR
jgi:hypothetical protein